MVFIRILTEDALVGNLQNLNRHIGNCDFRQLSLALQMKGLVINTEIVKRQYILLFPPIPNGCHKHPIRHIKGHFLSEHSLQHAVELMAAALMEPVISAEHRTQAQNLAPQLVFKVHRTCPKGLQPGIGQVG